MLASEQRTNCNQDQSIPEIDRPCSCTPAMVSNIARQLQGERLRLMIPPGHICRVQCQWVVVRGITIIDDTIYILDSLKIFDDFWVLGIPYDIARSIFQLPYKNIGIGKGEDSAIGRIVDNLICLRIRFMSVAEYLAIQRKADLAFRALMEQPTT